MVTKLLISLTLLSGLSHGQAISNAWYVVDEGHPGAVDCGKPSTVSVSSGIALTTSYVAVPILCSNLTPSSVSSFNYITPFMMWNSLKVTYGNFHYWAAINPATGPSPAVWLLGINTTGSSTADDCRLGFKLDANYTASCSYEVGTYTEIDLTEILGNSTTNVNQQIHVSPGPHNDQCTASTTGLSSYHDYEVDWSSGSLKWYIDGVETCSVSAAYVPSQPMFLIFQISNHTPTSGTYPETMNISYMRVCPTSTAPGNCTQANATIFDDEFTGTSSQPDIYVGQAFNGNATGADCSNSYGILNNQMVSWINDPDYWTNGTIGPGTNLHLCGAIQTQPLVQASGTITNPVKFTLEPGANARNVNLNGHTNIVGEPPSLVLQGSIIHGGVSINGGISVR